MPTMELIRTITNVTLRAIVLLSMSCPSSQPAVLGVDVGSLRSVGKGHDDRRDHDPQDDPEDVEWKPQDERMDLIPQGHGEAHGHKGDQPDEHGLERWFVHGPPSFMILIASVRKERVFVNTILVTGAERIDTRLVGSSLQCE